LAGLYNSTSLERLPIRGEKNLASDNALILMTLSVK
jgi:hypothetical protein